MPQAFRVSWIPFEKSCYNEQVLVMAVKTALIYGHSYYTFFTEVPAGRGRADLIALPLPSHPEVPAVLIEAKIDESVDSAIEQIRQRKHPEKLKGYSGNVILVGISYDKTRKSTDPDYKLWTDVVVERITTV